MTGACPIQLLFRKGPHFPSERVRPCGRHHGDQQEFVREIGCQIVAHRGIDKIDRGVLDYDEAALDMAKTFLEVLGISRNTHDCGHVSMERFIGFPWGIDCRAAREKQRDQ